MIDRAVHSADRQGLETVIGHELARGDAVAESARPALRQLVLADGSLPETEEVVARIRGMLEGIAITLVDALPQPAVVVGALTHTLIDTPALLSHLRAVALEWRIAEELQMRLALDPVVSPLLEELVSHGDAALRDLARKFLAAQARWCHLQRTMRLSLTELPDELFHAVILILRAQAAQHSGAAERAAQAEAELRRRHDEADRRIDLASRLVSKLGDGAKTALSLNRAGTALFLTALALGSGQDREAVAVWTEEAQLSRLALSLRSAGLSSSDAERQLLALHPAMTLPPGFGALDEALALALLNSGSGGI
ncbi:MAG TPA: hypothetical protein VJQ77_09400 [Novosphingobium sp.]|nr:hypothetical protein [Novosphingobium sp.]